MQPNVISASLLNSTAKIKNRFAIDMNTITYNAGAVRHTVYNGTNGKFYFDVLDYLMQPGLDMQMLFESLSFSIGGNTILFVGFITPYQDGYMFLGMIYDTGGCRGGSGVLNMQTYTPSFTAGTGVLTTGDKVYIEVDLSPGNEDPASARNVGVAAVLKVNGALINQTSGILSKYNLSYVQPAIGFVHDNTRLADYVEYNAMKLSRMQEAWRL